MANQQNQRRRKKKSLPLGTIALSIIIICVGLFAAIYIPLSKNANKKEYKPVNAETQTTVKVEEDNGKIVETAKANILSTGDVIVHKPILEGANKGNGTYDFFPNFKYIKNIVSSADYAVVNLELTLAGPKKEYTGFPLFNSPDTIVDALKTTGFDCLLTANNHTYDTRHLGLTRTVQIIDDRKLDRTGTIDEQGKKLYLVKEVNGIKFGILDYTYETPKTDSGKTTLNGNVLSSESVPLVNTFNYDELDKFYTDVKDKMDIMKKEGAEATIIYLHWGNEYQLEPNNYQKQMAQKLCDMGIDLLVGGHPHVIQPTNVFTNEKTGKKMFCIYSVGNALSNQRKNLMPIKTGHTEDGIMLQTEFTKYSDGSVLLTKVDYVPTWINKTGGRHYIVPVKNIMNSTSNLGLNADTGSQAKESYQRTFDLVNAGIEEYNEYIKTKKPQ